MPAPESRLVQLAQTYGIEVDSGLSGAAIEDVRAVLMALGVDAKYGREQLAMHDVDRERWAQVLPQVIVKRDGWTPDVPVRIPQGSSFMAWVECEAGEVVHLKPYPTPQARVRMSGVDLAEYAVELPKDLPLGYHEFVVDVTDASAPAIDEAKAAARASRNGRHRTPVIVVPRARRVAPELFDASAWGVRANLVGLRSDLSWGVGDLADLSELGTWARVHGADMIHASAPHAGSYRAAQGDAAAVESRAFLDPMLIRVEEIRETGYLSAAEHQLLEWNADDAHRLNATAHIDLDAAWAAKRAALQKVFAVPRRHSRRRAFTQFVEAGGPALQQFGCWRVLHTTYGPDMSQWPSGLQRAENDEVARFATDHTDEIEFEMWLQWVAAEQLKRTGSDMADSGMRVGLIQPLPAGESSVSFEVWAHPQRFARGVTVYSGEQPLTGMAALRPHALAADGYRAWRDILATLLPHSGALYLERPSLLFSQRWRPDGGTNDVVIRVDHEALVGVLLLEASRQDCLVIAGHDPDLTDEMRSYLNQRGIMVTRELITPDGRVRADEEFASLTMATATSGTGGMSHAQREAAIVSDEAGTLPEDQVAHVHRLLAQTPSLMRTATLEDLVGASRDEPSRALPAGHALSLIGENGRVMTLDAMMGSRRVKRILRRSFS